MAIKAYIITTPCAGKTYIKKKFPKYRGITLIDHNDLSLQLINDGLVSKYTPERERTDFMIKHLRTLDCDACILGAYLPDNPSHYPDVLFRCVVLNKYLHHALTLKRRVRTIMSNILNRAPIGTWLRSHDKWEYYSNTSNYRNKVIFFAKKFNISIYATILSALDDIHG